MDGRFPHFYVIVFQGLRLQASTCNRIRCVVKRFHSGERFQKFAVTVCVFTGYVWTKAGSVTKRLRIQTNPDTCGPCGQDLREELIYVYRKLFKEEAINIVATFITVTFSHFPKI